MRHTSVADKQEMNGYSLLMHHGHSAPTTQCLVVGMGRNNEAGSQLRYVDCVHMSHMIVKV